MSKTRGEEDKLKGKKKTKKLTKAQEGYIMDLVAGMSKTDAYKNNYKTDNMKLDTIHKRASEVFKLSHVKAKYNELMKKVEEETELIKTVSYLKDDAVKDLIYLKDRARESIDADGLKQANSQAFLNAVKELCTIQDLYPKRNKDELGVTENQVADDLLSIMEQVKNSVGDNNE